jgi:uncharacterized protein with HEPN domain
LTTPRLGEYLEDIEEAAAEALEFISAHDLHSFKSDRKTQKATVLNLIIIG